MSANYKDEMNGAGILVTGASGGIGSAIASAFGQQGAVVGVHYNNNLKRAEILAEKINQAGGRALLLKADLLDVAQRDNLVVNFIDMAGRLDVLINNAGAVGRYLHFSDLGDEDWDHAFSINAKAPFKLASEAARHMEQHGGGRIINISTTAVKYAGPNSMHYTASKAALEMIGNTLAKWGASRNILVNTIRCGLIDSGMGDSVDGYSKDAYQKRLALVPVGRAGLPDEVAALALFLASQDARFVTNQIWAVAGGD